MVGGRYVHLFNDRWLLSLRADIGGGDTESSWNALALLGWKFGGDLDNAVLFGWRHMEFEIEEAAGKQTSPSTARSPECCSASRIRVSVRFARTTRDVARLDDRHDRR